jgi:hypothetical protein
MAESVAIDPQVCIANISPRERQKRLVSGVISLVAAIAILAGMMAFGLDRWWRLLLFAPFFLAAAGILQWREKT